MSPTERAPRNTSAEFTQFYEKLREQYFGQAKLPSRLYHYTDASGLIGIVKNRELWITNYKYMNDQAELTHGVALVNQILRLIRENVSIQSGSEADIFFSLIADSLSTTSVDVDPYIACFSEEMNDLNQWRVYGREAGSYCIEFDAAKLAQKLGKDRLLLFRAEYDFKQQSEFLKALLAELVNGKMVSLTAAPENDERVALIEDLAAKADAAIAFEITRYKMAPFKVEREWRAIATAWNLEDARKLDFRVSRFGLTPYCKINLADEYKDLPITQIVAGPSRYPEHSAHSLMQLIRSLGLAEQVQCAASHLPIQY